MALRFAQSFDYYTTILQKWTQNPTPDQWSIQAAAARTGAAGLRQGQYSSPGPLIAFDDQSTWIIGIAYKPTVLPNSGYSRAFIVIWDGAAIQGCVRINDVGQLLLCRGANTVVSTSTDVILPNVYQYVELKHIVDNASGTLETRINGEIVATFTGDTQATANAFANRISLGSVGGEVNINGDWKYYDDLYILDGVDQSVADPDSPSNNNYLGDIEVDCILPDGAGNYTEFETLVNGTHWGACSEANPDDDTSYVEDDDVDDRDTFTFGNVPLSTGTIYGIQVNIRARKTAAGDAELARMYRRASTDNQGDDAVLSEDYTYISEIMGGDPIASGNWTITNINAAEFGFRVR